MSRSVIPSLTALSLLISSGNLQAQNDWTQFRGPTGQGIAGKAPKSWGLEKGVAWKIPLDKEGWSSPVISDGKVVLTGSTGEGDELRLHAFALDIKTGSPVWSKELFTPTSEERQAKHAKNTFASSTPLIHGGMVYAHFGHMGTAALKLDSGEVLWKEKLSYAPMHGGASSPIIAGDKLVFSADGKDEAMIFARDAKSGEIVWKTQRTEEVKRTFSFSTPLLVDNNGRQEIISPASGMVGGYSPKDGKQLWKLSYDEGFSVVPRPVVMDNTVFISTSFMKPKLLAIELKGAEGDITKSNLKWSVGKFMPKTPSFIANDGVIYVLDDTGAVSCIDAEKGESIWKEKLMGNFSASPVLADGHLYCITEDGVFYLMKVSPEKGTKVMELDLEQRSLASPAVVDGALFIRTETHLWKITGE